MTELERIVTPIDERLTGPQIKAIREATKKSQKSFAHSIGTAPNYLGMIERGERRLSDAIFNQIKKRYGLNNRQIYTFLYTRGLLNADQIKYMRRAGMLNVGGE